MAFKIGLRVAPMAIRLFQKTFDWPLALYIVMGDLKN